MKTRLPCHCTHCRWTGKRMLETINACKLCPKCGWNAVYPGKLTIAVDSETTSKDNKTKTVMVGMVGSLPVGLVAIMEKLTGVTIGQVVDATLAGPEAQFELVKLVGAHARRDAGRFMPPFRFANNSEPHFQNIPIRTPLGKEIREAFTAHDEVDDFIIDKFIK